MTDPEEKQEQGGQDELREDMKALYDELSVMSRRLESLRGRLGDTLRKSGIDVPQEGGAQRGMGGLEDLMSQVSNMFGGDFSSVLAGFGLGAATQAQADDDDEADDYDDADDECCCGECDEDDECDCDDDCGCGCEEDDR